MMKLYGELIVCIIMFEMKSKFGDSKISWNSTMI